MPSDLTTQLSKFLIDLWSGSFGSTVAIQSLTLSAAAGSPGLVFRIAGTNEVQWVRTTVNVLQMQRVANPAQFIQFQLDGGGNSIIMDGPKVAAFVCGPNTITSFTFGAQGNIPVIFLQNNVETFRLNTSAVVNLASLTATPAAGSAAASVLLGTTASFGVYYGSGAPTVSAAQGSIYLRSDGSSTTTRLYVNNSAGSGTTWTNFITTA